MEKFLAVVLEGPPLVAQTDEDQDDAVGGSGDYGDRQNTDEDDDN